jgi:hypothetical protein
MKARTLSDAGIMISELGLCAQTHEGGNDVAMLVRAAREQRETPHAHVQLSCMAEHGEEGAFSTWCAAPPARPTTARARAPH